MASLTIKAVGSRSGDLFVSPTIDLVAGGETPLSGNIGGTLTSGTTYRIVGDCTLTSNLVVEGTLLGIDTFTIDGAGFEMVVQNGGRISLIGVAKTGWLRWGETPVGWANGDRLGVVPTKRGAFFNLETTWTTDWNTVVRPSNAPDVVLIDRTAKPEVANLDRSIILQNFSRIHFHDGAGVQTMKWLKVLNCGLAGVLSFYPIHFHLNGEASRGSLIEGVLVEDGRNHAFVPHGSHGITFYDCVAWNIQNDAFWWDPPFGSPPSTVNDSHDTIWSKCLVSGLVQTPGVAIDHRLTAFNIGAGNGNFCIDSVAAAVRGSGQNISGFLWRENFVWIFERNVAHNVQKNGIYTWTNSSHRHIIDDYVCYHYGRAGIEHGAYINQFVYINCSITVVVPVWTNSSTDTRGVLQHANSRGLGITFENIITDDRLVIDDHNLPDSPGVWSIHRNCSYAHVDYRDLSANPSNIRYEDCGLVPADFIMTQPDPDNVVEVYEGGVLMHRWDDGAWTSF